MEIRFLRIVLPQNVTLSLAMMEFDQTWTFVFPHTCCPYFDNALRQDCDLQMTYLNYDGAWLVVTWIETSSALLLIKTS